MSRAPLGEAALRKAIASGKFSSVYYLYGDEDYLKARALRSLIDGAVDPATRDFNLDLLEARQLDARTLHSALSTPPMMADRRLVVVREPSAMSKSTRETLDEHLARARAGEAGTVDVVLVLVASGEKAKVDKALEALPGAVKFDPLPEHRVPQWISAHVSAESGASITPEAASLLAASVGSDLAALSSELDKLSSFTNGGLIDERAVDSVVGVRRGETLVDLLDRVAERDASGALALVSRVLEQPKMTAVSIVMALTAQMLALAWGQAQRERGRTPDFFELLKSGGSVFTGRPWGDAANAWRSALGRWTATDLDTALAALLDADVALKETRLSSDEQVIETLVLALCLPHAGAAAAPR
jgi:DNA polymerase-3 subunit delta